MDLDGKLTDNQIHEFMRLEQPENSPTADFVKAPIKGVEMLGNRLIQHKIYI